MLAGFLFVLQHTAIVWGSQLASASGFPVCVTVYGKCNCMGVSTRKCQWVSCLCCSIQQVYGGVNSQVLAGFLFVLQYTTSVWGCQLASASGFPVCVAVYSKCMGVSTRKC